MSKANRVRVDYMPGPAALEALQAAQGLHPRDNTQALLDRLVITGLSALVHGRWEPPRLFGRDREHWRLPEELRQPVPVKDG
ncbi:MAG: hypothetical protein ACK5Y8_00800 [Betaproteobacteria bacterium]|jgi:hypothetical protein|nr:hypothetical protein [Rubrivivax sp.]